MGIKWEQCSPHPQNPKTPSVWVSAVLLKMQKSSSKFDFEQGRRTSHSLFLKPELQQAMMQYFSWFGTSRASFNFMDTRKKGFIVPADFARGLTSFLVANNKIKLKTLDTFELFNVLVK